MTNDVDTLATALYATTGDMLKEHPDLAPRRPPAGITPRLSDAELVTLASLVAKRGFRVWLSRWVGLSCRGGPRLW